MEFRNSLEFSDLNKDIESKWMTRHNNMIMYPTEYNLMIEEKMNQLKSMIQPELIHMNTIEIIKLYADLHGSPRPNRNYDEFLSHCLFISSLSEFAKYIHSGNVDWNLVFMYLHDIYSLNIFHENDDINEAIKKIGTKNQDKVFKTLSYSNYLYQLIQSNNTGINLGKIIKIFFDVIDKYDDYMSGINPDGITMFIKKITS